MAKPPTPEAIAEGLAVPERVLLFCLASGTRVCARWLREATRSNFQPIPQSTLAAFNRNEWPFSLGLGGPWVLSVMISKPNH
jgi:hypothetical protein